MALESRAGFNLNDFKAQVLQKGLARSNRFEVLITPPPGLANARTVNLLVEQASMPLLNIFTKPFKIFGPTYQKPITSEYGGEGLAMTFHVDREMRVRQFFEDWMHLIVNPVTFTVGYQDEYSTSIYVRQLDERGGVTHEIELLEAFPRNMNLMDLNHSSSNQTHRLNVLFAYRYWKNTRTSQTQGVDIPRALLAPQVPTFDLRLPEAQNFPTYDWSTGNIDETGAGSSLPPSA